MANTFKVSCHCGNIQLEVTAELGEVVECNCPICGIAVIRTSTEYPPPISINGRRIENVDVSTFKIRQFYGKHAYP